MLTVHDTQGNDLLAIQLPDVVIEAPEGAKAQVDLAYVLSDTDTTLPITTVYGTLDWRDSKPPTRFSVASGSTVRDTRLLKPGKYLIALSVANYKYPVPDQVSYNFSVEVRPPKGANIAPAITGPVLPFRRTTNWNFELAHDVELLKSSVYTLLSTSKGERVMEPEYGTGLRSLIFESGLKGIETVAREEVAQAVARWEPRVSLINLVVSSLDRSSAVITADFVSNLASEPFSVSVTLTR